MIFFKHAFDVVGVDPSEIVFLDDIGHNVKAGRELGMYTIRTSYLDSLGLLISNMLYRRSARQISGSCERARRSTGLQLD